MKKELEKEYQSWLENPDQPIIEIKILEDHYERNRRVYDDSKDKVVKFYYKVEWLQGIYRSFRRFKELVDARKFFDYLKTVASKNVKIYDII